jgi:epoxide hydrolase-like predicted phosphatase
VVESCVEKLRKPDKAIFDITLERLGVAASEAVFLDDIGGNLKTAKQMGMETIKVKKHPPLDNIKSIYSRGYFCKHLWIVQYRLGAQV